MSGNLFDKFVWICPGLHDNMVTWNYMMTSSVETFSALLAICAGNSPVPGEFPAQRPGRGALMFSLICVWMNVWVNNREDLRLYSTHYDITVMIFHVTEPLWGEYIGQLPSQRPSGAELWCFLWCMNENMVPANRLKFAKRTLNISVTFLWKHFLPFQTLKSVTFWNLQHEICKTHSDQVCKTFCCGVFKTTFWKLHFDFCN